MIIIVYTCLEVYNSIFVLQSQCTFFKDLIHLELNQVILSIKFHLDAVIYLINPSMMLFDYIFDNDLVFYSLFSVTGGLLTYKFISNYRNLYYVDKEIQTDVWEDYSDRPSQILQTSPIGTDTQTPRFSPVEQINMGTQVDINTMETGIQTSQISTGNVSTATTVLPIPPVEVGMVPNPDIVNLNPELIDFESVSGMNSIIENTVLFYQAKGYSSLQISQIIMESFSAFN